MSAICGIFHKKQNVDLNEAETVMSELGKYRFDRSDTFYETSVFLGCHQKYVVPESFNEILPYEEGPLVITADAIVDNRKELFDLLSLPDEKRNMPDSLLILEAYKRWGNDCPERLVGDFAFAIWDKTKQELFCVRDHVGKRSFYYYNSGNQFAFSTTINPLFGIKEIERRLNDIFIADFLSMVSVKQDLGSGITIYEGIFQLPPACAMIIKADSLKTWQYWEIRKTKEIRFATDQEYEEAFRAVYAEAVRCRLRSVNKVGIMLSGGLDSGSAAYFAAEELKKKNEILYSFTQVPMEGYKDYLPENKLADEREYVEEICRYAVNIEPYLLTSEGKNSLTEIDRQIECFGQPYKTYINSYWINELFQTAGDMGVGVLLSGQTGNATISWGNFHAYANHLLKTAHFLTLFKEIKAYSVGNKRKPGKLFLSILFDIMPYKIRLIKYRIRGGKDFVNVFSPVNRNFHRSMQVSQRFKKYNIESSLTDKTDSFGMRMKMLDHATFSHLGAMETIRALTFGIEKRDPTRDKRVIEFCMNLPENQWVRNGEERRFIRHAMKGYMPDKVRLNTTVRGRQAADWIQRIMPDWDKIWEEVATIGENELERKYLDIPLIKKTLEKNKTLKEDDDGLSGINLLMRALIFARFLRGLDKPL